MHRYDKLKVVNVLHDYDSRVTMKYMDGERSYVPRIGDSLDRADAKLQIEAALNLDITDENWEAVGLNWNNDISIQQILDACEKLLTERAKNENSL